MQVDLNHLHHWMQAIRQSPDPIRTMDAFWQGQLKSKEWLIKNLRQNIRTWVSVDIYGGWVGVLASMMFQSDIYIKNIRSIDIDPSCEEIARNMNKIEEMVGKFQALTGDMCDIPSSSDVVINTSCEHITQEQYQRWLSGISRDSLLVLQSNNYQIPEHIRIADSLAEFKNQCDIDVLWEGQLELPMYTRFMIIGKKYV
jgi:hypothetical protein